MTGFSGLDITYDFDFFLNTLAQNCTEHHTKRQNYNIDYNNRWNWRFFNSYFKGDINTYLIQNPLSSLYNVTQQKLPLLPIVDQCYPSLLVVTDCYCLAQTVNDRNPFIPATCHPLLLLLFPLTSLHICFTSLTLLHRTSCFIGTHYKMHVSVDNNCEFFVLLEPVTNWFPRLVPTLSPLEIGFKWCKKAGESVRVQSSVCHD